MNRSDLISMYKWLSLKKKQKEKNAWLNKCEDFCVYFQHQYMMNVSDNI